MAAVALLFRPRSGSCTGTGARRFYGYSLTSTSSSIHHHHHHHHHHHPPPHQTPDHTSIDNGKDSSFPSPPWQQQQQHKLSKVLSSFLLPKTSTPTPTPNHFITPPCYYYCYSTSSPPPPPPPSDDPQQPPFPQTSNPNPNSQEIVGPTVERDLSSLANEMRQVLDNLFNSIFKLTKALALLSFLHLSYGAYISHTTQSSPLSIISIQSFAGFAFPFSLAFLLRHSLKPISFFRKMEQHGRLQILTFTLQVAKTLNLFFLRLRAVSFSCLFGLLAAFLFNIFPK